MPYEVAFSGRPKGFITEWLMKRLREHGLRLRFNPQGALAYVVLGRTSLDKDRVPLGTADYFDGFQMRVVTAPQPDTWMLTKVNFQGRETMNQRYVASSIWMTLMGTFRRSLSSSGTARATIAVYEPPCCSFENSTGAQQRLAGVAARRAVGATIRTAISATLRLRHGTGAGGEETQRHAVHAIREATTSRRLVVHFMISVRLSVTVDDVVRHIWTPVLCTLVCTR